MALKQNQKLLLHVKSTKTVRGNSFFIVEHDGVEYSIKQFSFQIDKPVPNALPCWVKDADKGELVQDRTFYFKQLYKEGEIYPFRVRNDFTHTGHAHPYYEIIDNNGIFTRLYCFDKKKLNVDDQINCRIVEINDKVGLSVELIDVISSKSGQAYMEKSKVARVDNKDDNIEDESYSEALKSANQYFQNILHCLSQEILDEYKNAVETYCSFCESILETEYFDQPDINEKGRLISRKILSVECLNIALDLNETGMSENYVEQVISKLGSRFFYKKEEKILTAYYLLGIFLGEDATLRYAYLKQLLDSDVQFTSQDKAIFNKLAKFDKFVCTADEASFDSLRFCALRLLMSGDMSDNALAGVFVSSLVPYAGTLKDVLLDTIICYTLSGCPYPNVLSWSDLNDFKPQLIAGRIANAAQPKSYCNEALCTGKGYIAFSDGKLNVSTSSYSDSLKEVMCSLGLLSDKIRVLSSDKIRIMDGKVQDMMNAWQQAGLSSGKKVTRIVDRSRLVTEGSEVVVKLDSLMTDENGGFYFACTIMDGTDSIHGQLPIVPNMVRYFVTQADLLIQDEEPVYLPAIVQECRTDGFIFSCLDKLTQKIIDMVSVGDEVPCKIKSTDPKRGCVWLSKYGYNVYTPYMDVPQNAYYMLQIENVACNGYIKGSVLEQVDISFYDNDAFYCLVDSIRVDIDPSLMAPATNSSNKVWNTLSVESVQALMGVLEQKADIISDFYVKFNLLNILKLMALITDNQVLCDYYKERLRQLGLLRSYLTNGHVDMDVFFKGLAGVGNLYDKYPTLKKTSDLLSVLSYMDNKEGNEKLMDMYHNTDDSQACKLAGLILACNLLDEYDIPIDRSVIRKEVVGLLNMSLPKSDKSDILIIGAEDYHNEFKTSIVYPADNNMLPDMATQIRKIVSVIAGFLNADGGHLYIGVNNWGVPVGISDDLKYLGSKDKFELELHNAVRKELGKDINTVLSAYWNFYDYKEVYVIDIPSYHEIVTFRTGQVVYCRQQTSTVALDKSAADLQAERKRIRFGGSVTMPVHVVPEVQSYDAISVKMPESKPAIKRSVSTSNIYRPFCCLPHNQFDMDFSIYLNYLTSDEYLISDHPYGDKNICLTVPFEDEDKQLVQLYNNGNIVRTSLKILGGKKKAYPYKFKNYKHTDLSGVTIADRNSKLFVSLLRDGQLYGKVINMDSVQESKDICSIGKPFTNVQFDKFTSCLQVPDYYMSELSRITENRTTNIGFLLTSGSFRNELETLKLFVPQDLLGID